MSCKDHTLLVLALDTSSKVTSITLARGDAVIGRFVAELDEKRSERLWTEVELLLREAGAAIHEVGLFSVCVGPGGFTGLRVGIAAAKGLADAAGKPAAGVTSLEAIAYAAGPAPAICVMAGSYRGEVYSQLFSCARGAVPVPLSQPVVTTLHKVLESISRRGSIVFAGDGAEQNAELIKKLGMRAAGDGEAERSPGESWVVKPSPRFLADEVARLGLLKYLSGESCDGESLKACYVRPADAEVKLALGLLGIQGASPRSGAREERELS